MKAQRLVLLAELHGVTLTRADLDADDGLQLSGDLMEACGFIVNEKVDVYCLESGTRLSCRVQSGAKVGEASVGGAAAQLLRPGARLVVASWGWVKEKQALKHEPRLIRVNADNARGS